MTSISTLIERRIDDFYLDLRDYVALVFDGDPEEVAIDWNCVGATLSYRDDTHNIFLRLWETFRRTPQPPRHDNDCGDSRIHAQPRYSPLSGNRRPSPQRDDRLLQMARPHRPNLRLQVHRRPQPSTHPRCQRSRLPHRLPSAEMKGLLMS